MFKIRIALFESKLANVAVVATTAAAVVGGIAYAVMRRS